MKKMLLVCLVGLLLSGCSVPLRSLTEEGPKNAEGPGQLLNIRIERWGDVRFSGLLAVRQHRGGLYYALLDATGVKLLEVTVAADGGFRLLHAKGAMRETGLDGFLSEVLGRIYLQEPASLPCSGTWLYQLCREEDGAAAGWQKYGQTGPLRIWQITTVRGQGAGSTAVVYRQPWIGVRILLESPQPL